MSIATSSFTELAEEVGGTKATVHLRFGGEPPFAGDWTVVMSNRAISTAVGLHGEPDAVATLERSVLVELSTNSTTLSEELADGRIAVDGDVAALNALFDHLDTFQSMFPIVEP